MKKLTKANNQQNDSFNRLSTISEISLALSANRELKEDLEMITKSVKEAFNADESYIMLLNRELFQLEFCTAFGKRRRRPSFIKCEDHRNEIHSDKEFGFAPSPGNGQTANPNLTGENLAVFKAFELRQRLLFTGDPKDSIFQNTPYKSAIFIPLLTKTQCVGLLVIANTTSKNIFSVNDLEEATVIANLAALKIEHTTLLNDREKQIKQMEQLNQLAKKLSTSRTFEAIIGQAFEYLIERIRFDIGIVSLFAKDEEEKRYYVSSYLLEPQKLNALSAHMNEISHMLAPQKDRQIKRQQLFLSKQDPNNSKLFSGKLKSYLTVPLVFQGKNIGFITLTTCRKNAFSRENLRTLTTISNLLATSVENVRITLDLERHIDEVSVLFEISQSITSTLDLDEVLDSIVSFSIEMINALRCELRLLDNTGEALEVKASRGLSKSFLASKAIKKGESLIGTCFEKRRPVSVTDIRKLNNDPFLGLMRKEKIAGLLAVPIILHNKSIGVITIYTSKPKNFSQSEIDLLSTFASQASIAIENAKLYADMKEQYMSMVMALAAAIEAKDSYTHGHSTKVMEYAVKISKEIGLDNDQIETVRYAGLLHDIGKIGVKDVILSKQGKLTEEEIAELHKHPEYGANIMERVAILKDIAPLTLYHHERYDGKGYPLGLKGTEIPLGARILAVADTYDAMIADRPYRKAFPFEYVKKEMFKAAGSQLDPTIVKVFFEILKKEGIDNK
jgi:HD-GYP domain-containing protein (c-di-GMP phosphodiesterase class II)